MDVVTVAMLIVMVFQTGVFGYLVFNDWFMQWKHPKEQLKVLNKKYPDAINLLVDRTIIESYKEANFRKR